jgi:23S rRNA (pseudouridine1915-N3)-methyltransferase
MKQFTLLSVGKVKESFCRDGIAEFSKRLPQFESVSIKESTTQKEGTEILNFIESFDLVVALDEHGLQMSSIAFAQFLKTHAQKKIVFVIGNADGLDERVISRADFVIALSQMTFTHEMAQLFFVEQLYRAVSIHQGKRYHRI